MVFFNFLKLVRHSSKNEVMPSQFEQDIAEAYVSYREINRPNLSIKILFKYVLIILVVNSVISLAVFYAFDFYDWFSLLSSKLTNIKNEEPFLFFILLYFFILIIGAMIFLKNILIITVKLYQCYAPEEVRRRCLFKPTCSEYTILALKKYGVIIGLYMAYIRVYKKCRGSIYSIDYP